MFLCFIENIIRERSDLRTNDRNSLQGRISKSNRGNTSSHTFSKIYFDVEIFPYLLDNAYDPDLNGVRILYTSLVAIERFGKNRTGCQLPLNSKEQKCLPLH